MDIKNITEKLAGAKGSITMCADGFIDEVWEIVDTRASVVEYRLLDRMKQFSQRIDSAGAGGIGLELIKKRRAFGGFTANIGHAAAALGVDVTMVGLYGKDKPDPLFEPLAQMSNLISLGDSATTHVLEFSDGKILMTDMEAMLTMSWERIVAAAGMGGPANLLKNSDIIGVGYWSLLPAFDDIVTQICAILPKDGKVRRFFFDFADVRKRDEASLVYSLEILKKHNADFPMTLSVNEHEAVVLFGLYNETVDDAGGPLTEKIETVREKIGLDELVIHTPQYAAAASKSGGAAMVSQIFVEKPIRTAGAGDTFNGGYIAGILAGLDVAQRLHVASAAVTYFLNNGFPPRIEDLF
ncbi:MAG: carbohydrate kinase family protein [Clostridiales bacterium]|jgi:sugar/nucleoside kinase (ribokinase family)|nr:carbohydrate kinase family protein [Clostridiales bacterium]